MKLAIVALAGALLLAGCAGDPTTKIDETLQNQNVQKGIDTACAVMIGAQEAWQTFSEDNDEISDKTRQIVSVTVAGVNALCTKPYPDNTASAVAKVIVAATEVIKALKDNGVEKPADALISELRGARHLYEAQTASKLILPLLDAG